MTDQRFCSNCRAPLPQGAAWCEACGTDAGDQFDGRSPQRQRSAEAPWWIVILLLVLAAGAWVYQSKVLKSGPVFDRGPVRVVGQRPGGARRAPGAKLSEPEAMMTLRRTLAEQVKSECLAVASRGYHDGSYTFDAVDSCSGTTLGRYKVDGVSGKVGR